MRREATPGWRPEDEGKSREGEDRMGWEVGGDEGGSEGLRRFPKEKRGARGLSTGWKVG